MIALMVVAVVVLIVLLAVLGGAVWWLITTAVVGLVIGALGRLVVPGRQPIGVLATIVAGLLGSIGGALIGRGVHLDRPLTFLVEVGVAAVLVAVFAGRSRRAVRAGHYRAVGRY